MTWLSTVLNSIPRARHGTSTPVLPNFRLGTCGYLGSWASCRAGAETLASFEPDIALIKVFPGSDPSLLDWYIDKGVKGVIFEGTGLGHLPTLPPSGEESRSWLPKVERAHEEGIFTGMTTQCIYGRVHPYVYKSLRLNLLAGMIYLEVMLAETAYVKLGSALGQFSNISEVQKYMLTNIAGEISHSRMDKDFKEDLL